MKKIVTAAALLIGFCAHAQDNQPLEVQFDDAGCPNGVKSLDESCGNGPDPMDAACRSNGAVVRWGPGDRIESIQKKPESDGNLHNCQHVQEFYQCVVQGNVDVEVHYNVLAENCQPYDPFIRIR